MSSEEHDILSACGFGAAAVDDVFSGKNANERQHTLKQTQAIRLIEISPFHDWPGNFGDPRPGVW
jgi:hypothetical protein